MAYSRREVQDHVTIMNKDLYDNLQDGIEQFGVTPQMFGAKGDGDETIHHKFLFSSDIEKLRDNIVSGKTQDCSEIFQSMVNSGYTDFYIPDGIYVFTKEVSIPENIRIRFSKNAKLVIVTNNNLFTFLGSNNIIIGGMFGVADTSIFTKSIFYFGTGNQENSHFIGNTFYNYKVVSSDIQNFNKSREDLFRQSDIGGCAISIVKLKSYKNSSAVCNTRFEDFYIYGFSVGIRVLIEDKEAVFPWITTVFFKGAIWFSRHCVELGRESDSSFLSNLYFDIVYQFESSNKSDLISFIDGNEIHYDCLVWDLPSTKKEVICYSGYSNLISSKRYGYVNLSKKGRNCFHEYNSPILYEDMKHETSFFINLQKYGGVISDKELLLSGFTSYSFFGDKLCPKNFKLHYEVKVKGTESLPHLTLYCFKGFTADYHYIRGSEYKIVNIQEDTGLITLDRVQGISINNYIKPSFIEDSGVIFSGTQIPPNFCPAFQINEVNEESNSIKIHIPLNKDLYVKYLEAFRKSDLITLDLSNKGKFRVVIPTYPNGRTYTADNEWCTVEYVFDTISKGFFDTDGFFIGLTFMDANNGLIPGNIQDVSIRNMFIEYI